MTKGWKHSSLLQCFFPFTKPSKLFPNWLTSDELITYSQHTSRSWVTSLVHFMCSALSWPSQVAFLAACWCMLSPPLWCPFSLFLSLSPYLCLYWLSLCDVCPPCCWVHSADSTKCFAFSSVWCAQVAAAFGRSLLSELLPPVLRSLSLCANLCIRIRIQFSSAQLLLQAWQRRQRGVHTNHTKPNTSSQH